MLRKSTITAALLITIMVGLCLTTPVVQAQEPLPNIVANVTNDWVEVWGLNTTDVPARLEVYRGTDPDSFLVCSQVYEVINGNPWLDCPESGIQAGDRVVLKVSDIQVKDLTVLGFTLDGFDPGVGDFRGTAPAGRTVFVTVCNPDQDCFDEFSTVNPDGSWTVSFGSAVVSPSANFWATIWEDDWDSTQASFIPPPTIEVIHTTNGVSAWGFKEDDQNATLEVRSPSSDLKCSGDFELNGSWDISLDCQEQNVNILPEDLVLLEVDGQGVNELVVQPVFITEYNPNEGVIRGTAPQDAYVQAEICNEDGFCIFEEVTELGGGTWEMYFDPTPFNYVGWVAAHLVEADGDQTIAEYIHRVIDANVRGNWISAWGFGPDDQSARLELWRGPDLLCDGNFDLSEEEPWLDCWEEGVFPGDEILLFVNDEIEPDKEHTVFDLTMDFADLDAGFFAGLGPSGTTVRVEVCPPDSDCLSQEYYLEDTTSWEISFDSGPFDPDSWITAFIMDEDGDQTMAELPPLPTFEIEPNQGWSCTGGWPVDVELILTVDEDDNPGNGYILQRSQITTPSDWDPISGEACFDFYDQADAVYPGLYVSVTDSNTLKHTWVADLTFEGVEEDGTAWGYGPGEWPGHVCLNHEDLCQEITVASNGTWNAVFSEYDPLTMDLYDAHVVVYDEDGDGTIVYLGQEQPPPQPWLLVVPEEGVAFGIGLPIDVEITLTITDPDLGLIYQSAQTPLEDLYNPGFGFIMFDLCLSPEQLHPGVIFEMAGGEISRQVVIVPLSFDGINAETLVASGIGPGEGYGEACLGFPEEEFCEELAWSSGSWTADFSSSEINLEELIDAQVMIWDDDGDVIRVNFFIEEPPPLPAFEIEPNQGWSCTGGWPVDVELILTVDEDDDPGNGYILQRSQITTPSDWDGSACFEFYDQANAVYPGLYVSVTDSNTLKHTWVADLTFEGVEEDGTAWGYGPGEWPGHVCLNQEGLCQEITVAPDGSWNAVFSEYDPLTMELYDAHVVVYDEDGDGTIVFLGQEEPPPLPFIRLNLTKGLIRALGWPLGDALTVEIDDPSTLDPVDFSTSGTVADYAPWEEGLTMLEVDPGPFLILPGYVITVSDSEISKELIVSGITVDEVDTDTDIATGTTTPETYVDLLAIGDQMEGITVQSGWDGVWTAQFSMDLTGQETILIMEWDEDGDSTELRWFPNHPPTALDDSYTMNEDSTLSDLTAGVLANDSDPDGDDLAMELVDDVQFGILTYNTDGTFSYTPQEDFFGTDSFSYKALDGELESNQAWVTITVNLVNDLPEISLLSTFSIVEGQVFQATGSFQDPDPDTWTGTVDFGDGSAAETILPTTEQTFNLSHEYPADDGVYSITVVISDGWEEVSVTSAVTISNVAPSVTIDSLAGGAGEVLVGLDVSLQASFLDNGLEDTHVALVDWGDGTQTIDPAVSPLLATHAYQAPGQYNITVTVTDDDGGAGSASAALSIIEPADVAETVIADLDAILSDPELPPEASQAVEEALVNLEGANDGASSSGALDKILGGQWNAALVKIQKAIQDLEAAEAVDPELDFSALKEALALAGKSVALDIITIAEASGTPAGVIDQAYSLVAAGQTLLDGGDYLGAVGKFLDAIHVL